MSAFVIGLRSLNGDIATSLTLAQLIVSRKDSFSKDVDERQDCFVKEIKSSKP